MDHQFRELSRFVIRGCALLLAVLSALAVIGSAFERAEDWSHNQDPRERILWDSGFHDAPMVLVGDSAFCSYYVDEPHQTLWSRLSSLRGVDVFPAALNGAMPSDMLRIVERVTRVFSPGAIVLVDINPFRIFDRTTDRWRAGGRYDKQFEVLIPPENGWTVASWQHLVSFILAHDLWAVRNQEWMVRYLQNKLSREQYFGRAPLRNQLWNADDGYALRRLRSAEQRIAERPEEQSVGIDWVRTLFRRLRDHGMEPVFVLTPLNRTLVHDYSGDGGRLERMVSSSHEYLVRELDAARIPYIDLLSALGSESFADSNHTNARGEAEIASALDAWLVSRLATHRAAFAARRTAQRPGID